MATPKWRGSSGLTESPESPVWDFNGDETTCERTFMGKYDVCLSSVPPRGAVMSGFAGQFVDRVDVRKQPGGKGIMVVHSVGAASTPPNTSPTEKYDREWSEVQRPLLLHPRYSVGGVKALTAADRIAIEKWNDCPDAAIKTALKYYNDNEKRDPAGGTALSAHAQDYAGKILKGEESYIMYLPIMKKTTTSFLPLGGTACGKRQEPVGFGTMLAGLEDYDWLKTADRASRTGKNGKYERYEEWTGVDTEWDIDIYEPMVE